LTSFSNVEGKLAKLGVYADGRLRPQQLFENAWRSRSELREKGVGPFPSLRIQLSIAMHNGVPYLPNASGHA